VLVGLADPDTSIQVDAPRFAGLEDAPDDIDGAIIATPTGLHSAHGIAAAERGWHMLIEKPVASDLASADALQAAITKAQVRSLVGHHRRYHTNVQRLKQIITDGSIGTPIAVNLIWAMRKPDDYFQGNWRTAGGSPVMINLVHDIDVLRFVMGEIVATTALRGAGLRSSERIETGAVALAFANGATGTISFADTSPSPWGFEAATGENPNIGTTGQDMLWFMGSKGAVSFPSLTQWSGSDWGTAARIVRTGPTGDQASPLDAQLSHFVDVMNGAAPVIDVADATRTLKVALQIEEQLNAQTEGQDHARSALG
jgi:predicted dehydrogenase